MPVSSFVCYGPTEWGLMKLDESVRSCARREGGVPVEEVVAAVETARDHGATADEIRAVIDHALVGIRNADTAKVQALKKLFRRWGNPGAHLRIEGATGR